MTTALINENTKFHNIPKELQELDNWVVWKEKLRDNGTMGKVPYNPNGKYPRSFKETMPFQSAVETFKSGKFGGIGFTLIDSGYVCIDLDGDSLDAIPESLKGLAGYTYTEYSPSGNGMHVWFKGEYPDPNVADDQGKAIRYTKDAENYKTEWFFNTGYVTFTGDVLNDLPIDDSQVLLDQLSDSTVGSSPQVPKNDNKKSSNSVGGIHMAELDDRMALAKALEKPITKRLYNNVEPTTNNDDSKADWMLAVDLAKITHDPDQIERIMRDSKLVRDKWDRHKNYLINTINKAINDTPSIPQNDHVIHIEDVENSDNEWRKKLSRNENGAIKSTRGNIQSILNNDANVKDMGRTNTFSGHKEVFKAPTWRLKDDTNTLWADSDEAQFRMYLEQYFGISSREKTDDALSAMFYENSYHPIKDYLNGLQWDNTPRVETLFIDYLGATDDLYTRTVTKKILVAAVARIFDPGVKFDEALILIGKQGVGKSYVLSRIGKEWFNESINTFSGDDALMKLRDSWIIELAELSAMNRSAVEEVKGFISAKEDTYRPKYGRNVQRFPRQCVFFGSTNDHEFLKDKTGNRRFLPVNVDNKKRLKNPYEELTDSEVDQLWAEAVHLYNQGEKLYIDNAEVKQEAERLQGAHTTDDGLGGMIESYLEDKIVICARQIWDDCLNNSNEPKRNEITNINQILRGLYEWEPTKSSISFGSKYGKQRGFRRKV